MSFGAVADDYDRVRPGPPAEAIDWLLPDRCDVVVDLAAGTGLLTRALAGKARRVIAVEPDGRMRAVLQSRSGEVEALAGRGEAIPLPADSADAVLVSSAWHWMNPDLAVPEIARVLRPGGRLGMLWTGRAADIGWLHADDWFSDARAEQEAAAAGRAGASPRGHEELWYPQAGSPAAGEAEPVPRIPDREARQVRLPDSSLFGNIETRVFRFSRSMAVPDIVDMLATYSGVITASPEAQAAGRARAAAALAAEFPGAAELEVPMRSRCWRADLAAGSSPRPARGS